MKAENVRAGIEPDRDDWPIFCVNFWSPVDGATGMALDSWIVTQSDLHGVLAWVEDNARGRAFELLVAPRDGTAAFDARSASFARLLGWDPNSTASPERRERMRRASTAWPNTGPGTGSFGWTIFAPE